MIVMKFGGTSNEDAAAMRNVVRIVKAHLPYHPFVVISAIARATNELEQTARVAALGDQENAVAIASKLFERHHTIIDNLITTREHSAELESAFYRHLSEIKALVKGIAILRELTPRTMDALCSFGERLSSRIIAAGLRENGVDAVWIDAKEFMITDENFGRAQPLMEVVEGNLEAKVRPLLIAGKTPVTQGFIGVTQSGAYTTMGRESSDYSASIIGAAMNADKVQIWTDVDGILTADPRVVAGTKKVKRMSFEEAFELSYFGAKVLHPNTMLPVLEKNIPVEILNSKRERGSGTAVGFDAGDSQGQIVIKSLAFKSGIAVIAMTPRKRLSQYLFWESIYSVLSRRGITVGITSSSEYSVAFTIDQKLIREGLEHELEEFGKVQVFPGKGSVCLVGKGMRGAAGIANRVFMALAEMNVLMVSYGASDRSLTLVLDEGQIPGAIGRLHAEFFEGLETNELFEAIA